MVDGQSASVNDKTGGGSGAGAGAVTASAGAKGSTNQTAVKRK